MKLPVKIALIALGLGLIFDLLLWRTSFLGLNILIAELLFLGSSFWIAKMAGHVLPKRAIVAGCFAIAYSATFVIWTSMIGSNVSLIGFLISNLLFVTFAIGHEGRWRHPFDIFWSGTFETGSRLMRRLHIVSELRPTRATDRQMAIIKGAVILVPILCVFILIFASADAVFRTDVNAVLDSFSSFLNLPNLMAQAIIVAFFFVIFCLFFAAAFWQRFEPVAPFNPSARFGTESTIVLAGVVLLFGAFILVQIQTLMGGGTLPDGLTYAEYARAGFDQLIFASILAVTLVLTARVIHGVKSTKWLTILHAAFIVETFFVLVSAFIRLSLYVSAYGYTPLRLFAYWSMATIAILLIMLLVSVIRQEEQTEVMRHGLLVLGVAALIFTISSPDASSAALNIRLAKAGGHPFDVQQLNELSAEAYPIMLAALQTPMPIENLMTPQPSEADYLKNCKRIYLFPIWQDMQARETVVNWVAHYSYSFGGEDWRDWNFSRSRVEGDQTVTVPIGLPFKDFNMACKQNP
jgi:hypothetical protein